MARNVQFNVRLTPEEALALADFCRLTRRHEQDVMRAALELLLADGQAIAERRLTARLWDVDVRPPATGPPAAADGSRRRRRRATG